MTKRLFLILVTLLTISSCDCFDCVGDGTFIVNPDEINCLLTAGSSEIIVLASFSWTITNTNLPDWFSLSTTQGAGGQTKITLSYQANIGADRIETLHFEDSNGNKETVIIRQERIRLYEIDLSNLTERVYTVTNDANEKIAEICVEYLRGLGNTTPGTVVYPYINGQLLKTGFVANTCGSVDWDQINGTGLEVSDYENIYTSGNKSSVNVVYMDKNGLFYLTSGPLDVVLPTTHTEINMQDGENNTYKITKIGLHYWTTSNLKAQKYTDGSLIPTNLAWPENSTTNLGACMVYQYPNANAPAAAENLRDYGMLYNSYTVSNGKLNFNGWKVPNLLLTLAGTVEEPSDVILLASYVDFNIGGYLMRAPIASPDKGYWSRTTNVTNVTGFSSIGCGWAMPANPSFSYFEHTANNIWSSSLFSTTQPLNMSLLTDNDNNAAQLKINMSAPRNFMSVRLCKDVWQ